MEAIQEGGYYITERYNTTTHQWYYAGHCPVDYKPTPTQDNRNVMQVLKCQHCGHTYKVFPKEVK